MGENSVAQIERDREVDRGCKAMCNKEAELMDRGDAMTRFQPVCDAHLNNVESMNVKQQSTHIFKPMPFEACIHWRS